MDKRSTPFEWFGQAESDRPASQLAVLDFVWGLDEFTATDVMAGTGLTRATAIEALGQLLDAGLVTELANAREAEERGVVAEAAAGEAGVSGAGVLGAGAGAGGTAKRRRGYRKGRPARRFAFRPEAGVVVGVDAGYAHLAAIVADLAGKTLATKRTLTGWDPDARSEPTKAEARQRQELVRSLIADAVKAAGRTADDLFAVCVGVPAPVNEAGNSPRHHAWFWQRVNPGLREALADVAPAVRVENDALLAAVAEGTVGAAQGCRNYVALLGGARMGAGVVIDGQLLRGANGAVGEMNAFEQVVGVGDSRGFADYARALAAQMIAAGADDAASDEVAADRAGARADVKTNAGAHAKEGAGSRATANATRAKGRKGGAATDQPAVAATEKSERAAGIRSGGLFAGLKPEELTGRRVFEAIEAGDRDALHIADQLGERLARVVTVIESFYDPELIVVSGAVGPAMLRIIELARAAMPNESMVPELVGSDLGAEAVAVGAVAAAVQMARARALDIAG